ncbi:pentatricopeptide repeat-containing protein At3g29230-like [Actinidia eriantha]|uniref:pentatricopeptide repeat-containing protein At3g29230-like n=1 Tax=Actinidia eriantha TaxID=165200 RepID=UPI00258F667F|nr:pentatricopeptide repeat-containing protein At3g29230-like [Actinidia eriantha]
MTCSTYHRLLALLRTATLTSQIRQIHAQLITTDLISDPFIASQLLSSLSSNLSKLSYAEIVFAHIPQPNTFMWNTIVRGHASSSNPRRALHSYIKMRRNGLVGDNYSYPIVLKASGMFNGLWEGREIHGEVVKAGFERDVFVRNGLIGMYCKTEELGCAWLLFDAFWEKDLVSWNLMLNGYVGVGEMGKAQKVFDEMPERDVISWSIMIDGYGKKIGDVIGARVLFDSIPIRDLVSWNLMIDSYAKVGEMTTARQLFEEMEEKNVISWSIIIDGYARNGNPKESLILFRQMLCQGVKPDKVSLAGALLACAQLGALDQGRWIHMYMKQNKIISDIVVQTALMDMYMKCGSTNEASMIFNSMSERNVVAWNVMISGLGISGFSESAVECFAQMEREGILMDDLIFVSVLTTCTHAGFVTEGLDIFDKMRTHGIEPKLEHYGCLIDLLGRSGRLNQAQIVLESMSIKPNSALWGSLLLACRTHKNVALAEVVLERLVELKADDCGVYILMSNIYADAEMWEGVQKIQKLMRERNMKKETGRSVIEVDGDILEFISGKKAHIQGEEIETIISSLLKMVISED